MVWVTLSPPVVEVCELDNGLCQRPKKDALHQDFRHRGLKQRIAYRQSVLGEGRSRMADPPLYGRSAPLMVGIVDEFLRGTGSPCATKRCSIMARSTSAIDQSPNRYSVRPSSN